MPHKCMECKNLIESGTLDLQKGCPICGGKKFQYIRPKPRTGAKPSPPLTVAEYVARAALSEPPAVVKEPPAAGTPVEPLIASPVSGATEKKPDGTLASVRPLPVPLKKPETRPAKKGPADKPDERVESIRVVEQGTYDINLPLLLSRKELIMSKGEGNYIVDLNSVLKKKKRKGRKSKNK